MDVGRVELQGISNEESAWLITESKLPLVLKDHDYLVRQHKLSQLKQKKTGLNVDIDEAVMRTRGSTGCGDMMI